MTNEPTNTKKNVRVSQGLIVSVLMVVAAAILALNGRDGRGWFLGCGFILAILP